MKVFVNLKDIISIVVAVTAILIGAVGITIGYIKEKRRRK